MIPVVIQHFINTMFNMVDNIMVGGLGGLAMTAVSTANKPYMVYSGLFFGMTGAAGLMVTQYYGAEDKRTCQGLFALQFFVGFVGALLYGGLLFFLPRQIMEIFVADEETIALGIQYMRMIAFSYLPVAVSSICIFSLRSLGKNRAPMRIGLATMVCNALLNYMFIFGNFGAPRLGVTGAALGTLLARTMEMVCYLVILARGKNYFTLDLSAVKYLRKPVIAGFVRRALPLTINEIFFGLSFNVYYWAFARLDEAVLPAVTVADLSLQIGVVVSAGMSSAVSVMVGVLLGAGKLKEAKEHSRKLLGLVCMLALVNTCVGLACTKLLPLAFNIAPALRETASRMILCYSLFYIPNAIYGFCFFCLRAGGDTKSATLLDSVYQWLLPVPAALLMGLFGAGHLTPVVALLMILLLQNSKSIPALWVVSRGKWIRNITMEG